MKDVMITLRKEILHFFFVWATASKEGKRVDGWVEDYSDLTRITKRFWCKRGMNETSCLACFSVWNVIFEAMVCARLLILLWLLCCIFIARNKFVKLLLLNEGVFRYRKKNCLYINIATLKSSSIAGVKQTLIDLIWLLWCFNVDFDIQNSKKLNWDEQKKERKGIKDFTGNRTQDWTRETWKQSSQINQIKCFRTFLFSADFSSNQTEFNFFDGFFKFSMLR